MSHRPVRRCVPALASAPLMLALAAQHGVAQTSVHWSQPVGGKFTDAARWGGTAPTDTSYDAFIDPAGATATYVVSGTSSQVTTGRVTVADSKAVLYFGDGTLNATRGVYVDAGSLSFFAFGALQAPSVRVAATGTLLFDSNYDAHLSIGTLTGVAQSRALLNIDRDLTFDSGTLSVQRNNVTMNNGARFLGVGTVLFEGDGGYVHGAAGAPFTVGAGVIVTAANGSTGALMGVNNAGSVVLDAANTGGMTVGGTNHGLLQVSGGKGALAFSGVNDTDGRIVATHASPVTTYIPSPLSLTNVENRGSIVVRGSNLDLHGAFTAAPGSTTRVEDGALVLYDTQTTATVSAVQMVNSPLIVRGTLDNTGGVLDVDALGRVDFQDGASLVGGRVTGTDGTRLSFSGPNNVVLRGVTLDIPVMLDQAGTGPVGARDGLTINRPVFLRDRNLRALNSQTYDGAGEITISYRGVPWPSTTGLSQTVGASLTIGPNLTVRSADRGGFIGNLNAADPATFVSLVNRGSIVVGADSSLTIGGRNWKNLGTISIEPGGMLNLGGTFAFADVGDVRRNGQIVNFASSLNITGKTFDLNESPVGPLDLGSCFIDGGRLVAPGRTVAVRVTDNGRHGLDMRGTTLALDLDLLDLANISATGDVALENATIRLKGGNSEIEASAGTAAITGAGTVVFDASPAGAPGPQVIAKRIGSDITVKTGASGGNLFLWTTSAVVTNEGTLLSAVNGLTFQSRNPLANAALIEARDGGIFKYAAGGSNTPTGTLHAGASGTVQIIGRDFVNYGTLRIDPTALVDVYSLIAGPGTLRNDGLIRINKGAQFSVETTVTGGGKVEQSGLLKPGGDLVADVGLGGDLVMSATATTAFQVGGPTAGVGFDRLTSAGAMTFGGTARVEVVPGYKPLPGDAFKVLRFPSSTGRFSSVTSTGSPAGLRWSVDYGPDSATIVATALSPADPNLDGKVDSKDVAVIGTNWLGSGDWYSGDLTGDGLIDLADLQVLRSGWPSTQAAWDTAAKPYNLPAVAVPEPGSFAIASLTGVLASMRRRRRERVR